MRIRAVALLIQNDSIAVMERYRGGRHYFTFPGGGVDEGETVEGAVVRELEEELGIQTRVAKHIATVWFNGNRQEYFLVEQTGGTFGTGAGDEFTAGYDETHGTYHPMWMPVRELLANPVLPEEVALMVVKYHQKGWPDSPVTIREAPR
ncbi:MAG: RNA pyrophosphohydrolase [Anaerolineales bacterium]|nr:RNA pyrophosphohydrolase [Anaerolineales bacterium]